MISVLAKLYAYGDYAWRLVAAVIVLESRSDFRFGSLESMEFDAYVI